MPLFYDIWTAKEADIKGIGSGLSCPLEIFSVVPLQSAPRPVILHAPTPSERDGWQLANVRSPVTGCAAALARSAAWKPFRAFQMSELHPT
ncbi:MAG: phosphopantetheinyl transferase [Limisphaerales bacterium]|jgi:phosphopantetheinyl transferase